MSGTRFLVILVVFTIVCLSGCSLGTSTSSTNANTNLNKAAATPVDNRQSSAGPVTPQANKTEVRPPAATEGPGGRIRFAKGDSSTTLSGGVVRGERAEYLLGAKRGQTMTIKITSLEDNAVFQIEGPSGDYLKNAGETDDATTWTGSLPSDGDYKIIVGGTRGNTEFKLTVSIK